MLQQVEQLGKTALTQHAASEQAQGEETTSSRSSSVADGVEGSAAGAESSNAAASVSKLLQQLPKVLESLTGDAAAAGMPEVLQALHRAEFGYADAASFMRGHLYQCPNGHMYVIGECGGAMQRSRCPECHAWVGGEYHNLDSSNRRADEGVLQRVTDAMRPS
jgi:hypothetical protein